MDTVRLRRLNRWQAEGMREDLADLYVESSATPPGQEFQDRQEFLRRLAHDVQQPGFDMLVAEAQSLTGCVFGFPVPRDGSWWREFEGPLPQNLEQLTASGHVFAITETVVHPHEHAHGLARRLQERLLADHQASLGVTLVDQSDRPARAAFETWGWQEAGRILRAPTVLCVVLLPLGERTTEHPDGLAHNARTQRPE
ncbi:GNAT family protein [Streptomyces cellulosae]|uniref:N-acetyltransferase domain-containing protein n=1 Tax=Streptomyces cellulosae TaxID=1968 RepID=A0ABW7Y321_STRCE